MTVRIAASLVALLACAIAPAALAAPPRGPAVDHHQHFVHKDMAAPGQQPIDAAKLVGMLDAAGIGRAVVFSNAYRYASPLEKSFPDELARVIAENEWTATQAAKYPQRLVALCSFNPLRAYAADVLARCAYDRRFGRAVKFQFGNSDVDLDDPAAVALLRRVFRAANAAGVGLVIHLRTSWERPYGTQQALTFIDELLSVVPDVPVQIAHLGGGGGGSLDASAEQVLAVFEAAIARGDPRVKKLYFDLSGAVGGEGWPANAAKVAQHVRALGVQRVLYGSDGGDPTDPPAKQVVDAFRQLPLTAQEFRTIETNVAPYLSVSRAHK